LIVRRFLPTKRKGVEVPEPWVNFSDMGEEVDHIMLLRADRKVRLSPGCLDNRARQRAQCPEFSNL
jgi:hypothetical protein